MEMRDAVGPARKPGQLERSLTAEKPWKKRQIKDRQVDTAEKEIQIFEGKPPTVSGAIFPSTPPESGYVRIISADDEQFVIPSKVVESFQCVGVILHSDAIFLERVEDIIRFPDIRPEVMECVLRFVFMDHLNREKAEKYWGTLFPPLVFQFEVRPDLVMEVLHAAHFLGISSLLKVAAAMVAHCFKDVPDVSSLPSDLAWCVAEEFSALDLFDAEERADFKSLDLDTERLWKKHCERLLPDSPIAIASSVTYPSYREWSVCEGPPPTSWKSLYVSHFLQQLADKQDGGENEAFFKEVSYRGKSAFSHTIRRMFWDWVMCGPGAWPLTLYLDQFPCLFSLSLANLPLYKASTNGRAPCTILEDILHNLPYLQHLDISDTGFTAEAATGFSKSLLLHTSLQVLRLACNRIKTTGFSAIAQTLPHVRTLKVLDVRENGISRVVDHTTMIAINASAVEVLLLTGNCKGTGGEVYESFEIIDGHNMENGDKLAVSILSDMPNSLANLQLSQCNLTDSHMQTLVKCLTSHAALKELDLSDNLLSSRGAIVILAWLKTNKSLRELSLAKNRISDSSSWAIVETLQEHPCLMKISFEGNFSFGESNLHEVVAASVAHGNRMNEQFVVDIRNTDISLTTRGEQFVVDLRNTDISHTTRGRLLRQLPELGDYLQLLL